MLDWMYMPSHEGRGGLPPHLPGAGEPRKEGERSPYYQAARFDKQEAAGYAYFQTQEVLFNDVLSDLSAYRLQLNKAWHVAVIGEQPSPETDAALAGILSAGELVQLPVEALKFLEARRRESITTGTVWKEGHYRPGKKLDY